MGNLSRLHLWGTNLPFDSASDFARALGRGGVGASEILAMELKSRGLLVARSLSFDGTSFETVACPLSHEQRHTYDAACALWAHASPRPCAAPVISTTLPERSAAAASVGGGWRGRILLAISASCKSRRLIRRSCRALYI